MIPMNIFPILSLTLLVSGCSTIINSDNKNDAPIVSVVLINAYTTKSTSSFTSQLNDLKLARKISVVGTRKSVNPLGYLEAEFDLRNNSYVRQVVDYHFEFLSADGTVLESTKHIQGRILEPNSVVNLGATAVKSDSIDCRVRLSSGQ